MKLLAKMFVLALAAVPIASASATQFVTNGGFEMTSSTTSTLFFGTTTPATDWTSTGSFVLICFPGAGKTCDSEPSLVGGTQLAGPGNGHANGLTASPNGGNYMGFDSDPGFSGTFSQTISGLTVVDKYKLSFYMAGAQDIARDVPTTSSITATLGTETYTTPSIYTPAQGFSPWKLYSTTFTYEGGGNVLSFLATGGPSGEPPYALLDGVSLNGVSLTGDVPEPSTWAMIVAGFAGMGIFARLRRKSVTAIA
jgi:hypothetical protein